MRSGLFALFWVAMLGVVFAFPAVRHPWRWLLGLGLVARLVLLPAAVSDDVNRYLWEGDLLRAGHNPYLAPADDPAFADFQSGPIYKGMNHKDRLTAYPPGMELVMAGTGAIWHDLAAFKIPALLGDLWTALVLILLIKKKGLPPRWWALYGLSPVVLVAFAAEAHLDSLMVAALVTTFYFAHEKKPAAAWLLLGMAVQFKLIAFILAPYLLCKTMGRGFWAILPPLVLLSLPFWEGLTGLFAGFLNFGGTSAFNGAVFESLRLIGVGSDLARQLTTGGFMMIGLYLGLIAVRDREKADFATLASLLFGSLLLFSPVVHFWYLTWMLPFLVLRPSLPWLLFVLGQAVYFFAWTQEAATGNWGYARELVVLSWLPGMIVGAVPSLRAFKHAWRQPEPAKQSATLALVVPLRALDAASLTFLKQLEECTPAATEIVASVATPPLSDNLPTKTSVVVSKKGRGNQITAGIDALQTSPDLIAIIHADTTPTNDWWEKIRPTISAHPQSPAFALGQRFPTGTPALLVIEALNEMRATLQGSIFGDQTMIIRRTGLEKVGGFPAQPLMEDVEASYRLRQLGPLHYLAAEWPVSAEKWHGRFRRRVSLVFSLMVRYRLIRLRGRCYAARFSKKLYQEYYGPS